MPNSLNMMGFSESKSQRRRERAQKFMATVVVNRIIAFALFLLGANRDDIARFLNMPKGTLFSLLTRLSKNGLDGLSDQRVSKKQNTTKVEPEHLSCNVDGDGHLCIESGSLVSSLQVASEDSVGRKILFLIFLENKLISRETVAHALGISERHICNLLNKIRTHGVSSLLDQRVGQTMDYRFTPEIKSELIIQFVSNVACNAKTSGHAISSDLVARTGIGLSERSVRYHLLKLGLSGKADEMKETICTSKKNFRS